MTPSTAHSIRPPEHVDVIIVGGGMAGLYALHKLRGLGFSAHVLEAGEGIGGTWFWNRYPGARCDVPSMEYSYSFSSELQAEWDWTEFMSTQPEIEKYLNHVADRFDLRRDITLRTRVTACNFDEASSSWTLRTENGATVRAEFCIMATGCLSMPIKPNIPGMDTFEGLTLQTSLWPRQEPDLSGKRVALIGTGSSAIQATPIIAAAASHLTVLQRSPAYSWPAFNRMLAHEDREQVRQDYPELRRKQRESVAGTAGPTGGALQGATEDSIMALSEEERQTALEKYGFAVTRAYRDVSTDMRANEIARGLYGQMVARVVKDPVKAAALTPRDYPLGCKRPVLDSGWFETFNRPNVSLIDLRDDPIVAINAQGIRTRSGEHPFDVIVYATGFDAMTGALDRIDIRGRDGLTLKQKWAEGPVNYLGLMIAGFPNLFTVTGVGSPSVLSNMVVAIEQHVDLIADCLTDLRTRHISTIEADAEAEADWVEHVNDVAAGTAFVHPSCNSWYLGANVPGKRRQFMPYVGGLGRYIQRCEEIVAAGYEGFVFGRSAAERETA